MSDGKLPTLYTSILTDFYRDVTGTHLDSQVRRVSEEIGRHFALISGFNSSYHKTRDIEALLKENINPMLAYLNSRFTHKKILRDAINRNGTKVSERNVQKFSAEIEFLEKVIEKIEEIKKASS